MADTPQRDDAWGSMLAGMLVGAALGAALSLLYAPKPGKELREDVGKRLDEMKDCVDQAARQLAETAKERYAEVKSDLSQAIDGAKAAAAEHAAELTRRIDAE